MLLGLQTFTVRKLMSDEAGIDKTFASLSRLGFARLELAVDYLPLPFESATAKTISSLAEKHGLKVVSCQIKHKTASADIEKTAEFMNILGAGIVTNSVFDLKLLSKGAKGVAEYCGRLNDLNERLCKKGLALAHHNHHYEFLRFENENVLNIMKRSFEGGFALDTFWCQKGGGNILSLLNEFGSRVLLLHLRDYAINPFSLISSGTDAAAGRGNLPFADILAAAKANGVQFGFIEQKSRNPLEDCRHSINYLGNLQKKGA